MGGGGGGGRGVVVAGVGGDGGGRWVGGVREEVVKASKVQTEFRWSVQEVCVGDLLLEC